jgi:hypothetical protein
MKFEANSIASICNSGDEPGAVSALRLPPLGAADAAAGTASVGDSFTEKSPALAIPPCLTFATQLTSVGKSTAVPVIANWKSWP